MKLQHTLSLLSVLAAGLAIAVPASAQEPRPYAIALRADAMPPLTPVAVRYPHIAASRGISGECRLSVDISDGSAHDIRVLSCSSELFRPEAKKAAERLTFAAGARAEDTAVTIRWAIEGDTPKTIVTASR